MLRKGHLPERTVQTGIGDVSVQVPKVGDRRKSVRFRNGQKLELVVSNVKFQDGKQVTDQSDRNAACPPSTRIDNYSGIMYRFLARLDTDIKIE